MTLNATGRPLAAADWLAAHHKAKLPERNAFVRRLALSQPGIVADLGCATGYWLDLLDKALPQDVRFIGVDSDPEALRTATERAKSWSRDCEFRLIDIELRPDEIPSADLILAFNIFSYVSDVDRTLNELAKRANGGTVAIRQYDGASIRFGPLDTATRQSMEVALRTAVASSQKFRHYDLDRTLDSIRHSPFENQEVEFELFQRLAPYPSDFLDYHDAMISWTVELLPSETADRVRGRNRTWDRLLLRGGLSCSLVVRGDRVSPQVLELSGEHGHYVSVSRQEDDRILGDIPEVPVEKHFGGAVAV